METEVTSAALQKLLGIKKSTLSELAQKGVAVRGKKRGTYRLATVTRYVKHLREIASARGGESAAEARARLGAAEASLAEARAAQLRGELIEASEVERLWTSKLLAFRNRILAIPQRVEYLSARQTMVLTQELRAALTELAGDAA
jgi:phage terminase Nu1 subunit (DNA packaging protein)